MTEEVSQNENKEPSNAGNVGRDNGGRFVLGHKSINGGKNGVAGGKGKILRDALYAAITAKDIQEIAKKLMEKAKAGNILAIKEVFDRSLGKVPQAVAVTGEDGGPLVLSVSVTKTYDEVAK